MEVTRESPASRTLSVPDHSKISFTAKFVAHGRARSDIPFAAEVAEAVGAKQVFEDVVAKAGADVSTLNWFNTLLEARYKSLTKAIERSGCQQVLEFASGVALRGLNLTRGSDLVYVETDLPAMSAEKVTLVEKLRAKHGIPAAQNLYFEAINILDWQQVEQALAHFDPNKPVIIIHEGLFPYLSLVEKTLAAQNIQRILKRFGGQWVTPDFHWHSDPVSSLWLHGPMAEVSKAIGAETERDFSDRSFASEEEIRDFLKKLGFNLRLRPQLDDSFNLTTLADAPVPPAIMEVLKEHLYIFEMTLA